MKNNFRVILTGIFVKIDYNRVIWKSFVEQFLIILFEIRRCGIIAIQTSI